MVLPKEMKAAVLHAPGDIRCESIASPTLTNDNEVIVKVMAAGVCGSDIQRVMVKGTYYLPTIPGHEFAGEIMQAPKNSGFEPSDRVAVFPLISCMSCEFCKVGWYNLCENYSYMGSREDGGFAQFIKVPTWNVIKIPDNLDFETAAATEPAAVALHALQRGNASAGDSLAILGAGPIGLFIAQWARALGIQDVFIVDILKEKLDLAIDLGFSEENCINSMEEDAEERIFSSTSGKGVSLAIDAAGVSQTIISALKVTQKRGRVVLLGNPEGEFGISDQVMSDVLRRELSIYGTWNSAFGTKPLDEWKMTLYFMSKGLIQVKPIISHRFTLDEAPAAFIMMYNKTELFHRVFFLPNADQV
jgi:L-iditol 2-dehydrogenase